MIPFDDFGGSGPLLHFAHANGYPPRTYTPLIETFTPRYHLIAMRARPLWPGSSPDEIKSWWPFVDDLIQFLDERAEKNVIGVGHSLGAATTLAAALRRPDLFRAVVLIDPVLLRPRLQFFWSPSQNLGLAHLVHPLIPGTARRRRVFENVEAMFENYRRKSIFRRIDDRGLRAYIEALARPRPDGQVELAYSPEWETKIYETGPINFWEQLPELRPPLLIVRGGDTDTFWPGAARRVQRHLPCAVIHTVAGATHLVPMEKPREVGEVIESFLKEVVASETQHGNIPVG